jgi:serine/threonine protein kinase
MEPSTHLTDPWGTRALTPSCPQPVESDTPDFIGRYRVEGILGKGGFGTVYVAVDEQLNRSVAIKLPRYRKRASSPAPADDLDEARILASLDHPNIVPIYDVGLTADGVRFVVSKRIDGHDLATLSKTSNPTVEQKAELVASIAEALHHAHRKGLVHRDVKPSNILVDGEGKSYLADFGLALKDEDFGKEQVLSGTPAYMSPEQARGEGTLVDGRSDIFSLGVVLYELLTRKRPFSGKTTSELLAQITNVDVRPLRQIDDRIPKELERICMKALGRRPSDRYATAADMAADICFFLASNGSGNVPSSLMDASPKPGSKRIYANLKFGQVGCSVVVTLCLLMAAGGVKLAMDWERSSQQVAMNYPAVKSRPPGIMPRVEVPPSVQKMPPIDLKPPLPLPPPPPMAKMDPPPPDPGPKRTVAKIDPPSEQQIKEVTAVLRDTFKADYARKASADRAEFAEKLLKLASESKGHPVDRYVLFREARDLAAAAGKWSIVAEAFEQLEAGFKVDLLPQKEAALQTLMKSGLTKESATEATYAALQAAGEAIESDRLPLADSFLVIASTASAKSLSVPLVRLVKKANDELKLIAQEAEAVKIARETLKKTPNDPAANLAVGRYDALRRGAWESAIPLLAKGGDGDLPSVARKELEAPKNALGRLKVADAWWNLAEKEKESPWIKASLQDRAGQWYRQAGADATGLMGVRIQQRLEAIEKSASPLRPRKSK